MKKLLFLALLAFVGVSCFAEVKVKRYGIPNAKTNVIVYWNNSYIDEPPDDVFAEYGRIAKNTGGTYQISLFPIGGNGKCYSVEMQTINFTHSRLTIMFAEGNFSEMISNDYFYDYNSAKREYDRYCAKYKEYVRKNYSDR